MQVHQAFRHLLSRHHRPLHLYWGGRDPDSDFLYRETLEQCLADKRLTRLTTSSSRIQDKAYVQDRIRQDAARIGELFRAGASIMVCGGDAMAGAVLAEFETILRPIGTSVLELKSRKRYLEDIF